VKNEEQRTFVRTVPGHQSKFVWYATQQLSGGCQAKETPAPQETGGNLEQFGWKRVRKAK